MILQRRITVIAIAAVIVSTLSTETYAQNNDEKKPGKSKSSKKKTPEEIRVEIENALPKQEGKDVFVFFTSESVMKKATDEEMMVEGPFVTRKVRKAHRIDGRKAAVDMLVEHLSEKPGDMQLRKGADKNKVMLGDIMEMKQRKWEFISAFPKTDQGEKEIAASLESARKRIADEERDDTKKRAQRKKLFGGDGK